MKNKDPSNHLLIRNLLVSTKTKHILHGVNAEAHSGDLMAVMGPTGKHFAVLSDNNKNNKNAHTL